MSTDLSNNAAPLKAGLNEGAAKRMAEMVNLGRSNQAPSNTSGMTCGSQVGPIVVKPVDRRTIAGSTPGDFRAKGADAKLPENPNPRQPMTQTPLSGRTPATAPTFQSDTEGGESDRA